MKQLHKAGLVPALLFYERVLALKPGKGFFHTFIEKKYFPLEPVVAVALDHLRKESRGGHIGSRFDKYSRINGDIVVSVI